VPLKGWTVIDALAQLGKALKAGPVAGLYLLVGEDVFTREQACRMIAEAAAALAPGGLERTVLYGDEATPELIMTAIGTGSLFGDQRLVVVRGFDRLPAAGQDQLVPLLTNLPAGVTAVLICAALDRKRKAMQALIRAARLVACDPPQQGALPQWIIQRARELGFAIQPEAVQVLLELAGSDLQALYTELEKLAVYGAGQPVDAAMVHAVASVAIPHAAEYAIFRFADAVAEGRPKDALAVLNDLLAVGQPPLVILSMIARQFRLILLAHGAGAGAKELAARLGLNPYVVEKAARQAVRVGPERAAAALHRVAEADMQIKTGRDPRLVLETLVVALAHLNVGKAVVG